MYFASYGDVDKVFHVGNRVDQDIEIMKHVPFITWIQADGHELEAIQRIFSDGNNSYTIPMPNLPVCRWYGDIAKTIHINMLAYDIFGGSK